MHTSSTINVSGPDAFDFLQGQLSNDLERLDTQASLLHAWCNPKGRVICLPEVRKTPEGYALSVPLELVEPISKRLTMYRFRAKVTFETLVPTVEVDLASRIRSGLAWIGAEQSKKFTPHMLNLDLLGAISFEKGCYPGQEIVARTHYKGVSKRRLFRFQSESPALVGDKISLDGHNMGEVLNAQGNELLAVIPVEKATEDLRIAGAPLKLASVPYRIAPG